MTTKAFDLGQDRLPAESAGRSSGHLDFADITSGGWTPAHSEAARFVGGCFAAGALLGLVREMARPMWGQRRG